MTKRTLGISELPWAVRCVMTQDGGGGHKRFDVYGTRDICTMDGDLPADEADATFIVRACNAHDDLVAALKALYAAAVQARFGDWRVTDQARAALAEADKAAAD